jgi:hypothetical protein
MRATWVSTADIAIDTDFSTVLSIKVYIVDSAQQIEKLITSVISIFHSREQPGKVHMQKLPSTESVQLFNRLLQTVYRSIQLDKKKIKNVKHLQVSFT